MKKLYKIGLMFLFLVLSFTSFSATTIKINFKYPTWLTTPCIYTWHGGGSASAERFTGTWPGSAMTVDSVHNGWVTTTIDIGSYTDDIKVIINNKNASGEVTSQTANIQIPNSIIVKDSAAEVWYDGTTWSSSTNKPSFSAITISPWVLKNVVVHYRNTSEFTSVKTLISSGTTEIYSNVMLPDANNPGWYSYTISTYENYPYNISFNNGYGITTSIYPIENGKTEVWFDSKRSYTGWLEKRDLLIHFRKPADWQTAYLYPFPDKKLGDYPGWGMTAETGHDEWFSFNLSDVEIPANIKFSDGGEDSKSVEIAIENINNNNEVWYDGLMNKFLNGYTSINYTKFSVKLDLTVLWGSDLPNTVYMYLVNSDGTKTYEDGKNYYETITGLSVQGKFCSDYRPDNNNGAITGDEQNTSGALKLTDNDYDGIYEGIVYYDGLLCPSKISAILYIRKDDEKNVMHKPMYELLTGANSGAPNVCLGSSFRQISISNGRIYVNGNNAPEDTNVWNIAWENKNVKSLISASTIDIYEGLTNYLNVEAEYDNANTTLRRNITKYINAKIDKENIAKISKEIIDGKVKNVKISGESIGSAKLTLNRNSKTANIVVNVKAATTAVGYQTAIYNSQVPFVKGNSYIISGAGDYGNGKVVKGLGIDAINSIINFTGTTNYLESVFSQDTLDKNKWISNLDKSIIMIPLERKKTTVNEELNVSGINIDKTMTLPKTIDTINLKNSGNRVTVNWSEAIDDYKNVFSSQKILVRVSKIESSSDDLKYDVYNKKNPITKAYVETNNSNADIVQAFDAAATGKYLDFDFDSGISQTRTCYDGRSVQYITSSTQKNLYIQNFKEGKYKVQLYTIRSSIDYSIVTFEKEAVFEISAESNILDEENGYYSIQQIESSGFKQIKAYFLSKTTEAINLTKSNITYDIVNTQNKTETKTEKVGERKEYIDPLTKKATFTGVVGKITPDNIEVKKDEEFSASKPPLDVIVCLDRNGNMKDYLSIISSAWKMFESEIKNRGYDVKFKLISYSGSNQELTISSWSDTIDSSNFSIKDNYGAATKVNTYSAMNLAIDTFISSGRSYAANSKGIWGYNENDLGIPSTKMLIYLTTSNANAYSVDDLEYKIRANSILVSGIANIKAPGLMFEDDYVDENGNRTKAEYASDNSNEYYYHLKMLLGNKLKLYQITTDSARLYAQLKDGVGRISVMDRWIVTYNTPYPEKDSTRRSVDFDIQYKKSNNQLYKMSYGGILEDRLYIAPNSKVDIEITNPKSNTSFQIDSADAQNVILTGIIREKNQGAGYSETPQDMTNKKVKVYLYKAGDNNELANFEYTIKSEDADSEGYYKFNGKFAVATLFAAKCDLFDVKAVYADNTNIFTIERNISFDFSPPSLYKVTIKNLTNEIFWENMKVFTSNEIENFVTTQYLFNETFTATNLSTKLENRVKSYDGHYAKFNDILQVTAIFYDENFDLSKKDTNKNDIYVTFENLGVSEITKEIKVENAKLDDRDGKKITLTFTVKVNNNKVTDTDILGMKLTAYDNFGKTTDGLLSNIEMAVLDNIKPLDGGWQSGSIQKKNNTGTYESINLINGNALTNDSYKVNLQGANEPEKSDTNGYRAFNVYYTYDELKSDWSLISGGRGTIVGNHDLDAKFEESYKHFYVKAGNGINSDLAINIIGSKEIPVDKTKHGDDGYYNFRVGLVDKAGNISLPDNSATAKELYVDTIAPKVTKLTLKKIKDSDPNFIPDDTGYPDNFVKKGDIAKINFQSEDYNSAHMDLTGKENYYNAEYSWLINGNEEKSIKSIKNPVNNKTEIAVELKDKNTDKKDVNGNDVVGDGILILSNDLLKKDKITATAVDLAGNVGIENIEVTLQNSINPSKLDVELWASEKDLSDYDVNYIPKVRFRNTDSPTNGAPHFTKGKDFSGSVGKNFRIRLTNLSNEIKSIRIQLNGIKSAKNVYLSQIPANEYTGNYYNLISFKEDSQPIFINGVNRVVVYGYNESGVETIPSDEKIIVVDSAIGNITLVTERVGGTAKYLGGSKYEFKLRLNDIPELSGLGKIRLVSLEGNNVKLDLSGLSMEAGTSVSPLDTEGLHVNFTSAQLNSFYQFDIPNIPTVLQGTRAKLKIRVFDYLANTKDISYEFLIPKRGVSIKAQAEGSEKETRTKVKVVGENSFDLEQSSETGKKAKY